MSDKQYRKFYVDWWNIKRSTVYGLVSVVVILTVFIGGGWWLYKNDFFLAKTTVDDIPRDAARIISFEGDVRVTRASTRETIIVTKTTYVSAGDTVQTQSYGRAQIQMIDGSVLTIRPNSTIVIRDSSTLFGGKNVRVAVDGGQINVKTEDQPADTENVVEVRESENKILSQTDASFGVNPNTDSGEIRVSRGGVESNSGGEKKVIQEGEFAAVANGKNATKEKILQFPKNILPTSQDAGQALLSGKADV
ncbi:MAG TPA: FecR domain-containing protein, partial [Pyrinomonadaceae bacterium]|nr:FecR domain-containing protein [Pyrinomonadaceae bacterium]